MEVKVLNGKVVADKIKENLKERVDSLYSKTGVKPCLAIITMDNDYASKMYVKMKVNACKKLNIDTIIENLSEESTTEDVLKLVDKFNNDDKIDGILIEHPLSKQIDERLCFNRIALNKDVDGVNAANFGLMAMKENAFVSATPAAIMSIIDYYNIDIAGKNVVVVGRSPILGKPVAMLLLNKNATVTICHSKTYNLNEYLKIADIVVAAVGKPKFIKGDNLKEGVIILDAGYNKGNVGDVDIEACMNKVNAYTPVPGGIGPVTIAKLLEQTVISYENKNNKKLTLKK